MHFFKTFAVSLAATAALAAPTASASCFVCDEVIELDAASAECFIENYATIIERFETEDVARATVDLGSCSDASTSDGERGGLDVMSGLGTSSVLSIKSVYIMDQANAVCLKTLIDAQKGVFDPKVIFDLYEACDGG